MKKIFGNIVRWLLNLRKRRFSNTKDYWDNRYALFTNRAELNLSSEPSESRNVFVTQTEMIKRFILEKKINGKWLDFGCGTGRFSHLILELLNTPGVAYDFSTEVTKHQTPHPNIDFCSALENVKSNKYDFIFISLVMGAMNDADFKKTFSLFANLLADDGAILLIENTEKKSSGHWKFRSKNEMHRLIGDDWKLNQFASYLDNRETITLFEVRKVQCVHS